MGSRYGGLKQIDHVGPNGEIIIDYSMYDAIRAGFRKIVFVIRHSFEKAFRKKSGNKLDGIIKTADDPGFHSLLAMKYIPKSFGKEIIINVVDSKGNLMKQMTLYLILCGLSLVIGCAGDNVMVQTGVEKKHMGQAQILIIPEPVNVQPKSGSFELDSNTVIIADRSTRKLGNQLSHMLTPAMGYKLAVEEGKKGESNAIILSLNPELQGLGKEGYHLTVTQNQVRIEAAQEAGGFYGIQTLLQLLPPEILSPTMTDSIQWRIPCVTIEDQPRFQWRGMHLDVVRHFMPTEFVKKFIDLLAMHKMNTFHWHLTDDQGWRIESKKYPKLTDVGAWRKETVIGRNSGQYDGKRYGGFYTQDEIREIVEYAKQRYITVIPEIEMPGHSRAALAAYPELSCTGGPFEVKTNWGVEPEVYCAGNKEIFEFLQDVLDEVMALFPGKYIHLGGDECPKERWKECPKCQARIKAEGLKDEHELQSWFIKRMEKYLNTHGRRLIGWDEILEGGLAPNATVMSWRGEAGGIAAAQSGHDVVMAPNSHTYFDYYQADPEREPLAIGGFVPLEKVYAYNPVPEVLSEIQQDHILGVQAQLWSEYIPTPQQAEYMAYPRACALAEVAWTPVLSKDYGDFYQRMKTHVKRLKALDVNFRPLDPIQKIVGQWKSGQTLETFQPMQWDITSVLKEAGTYKVIFQYSGGNHRLDIESVQLLVDNEVIAKDKHLGITGSIAKDNTYSLKVNQYDPSARYLLRAIVRSDGGTDSNGHVYLMKD